jgi:hypothetical protein
VDLNLLNGVNLLYYAPLFGGIYFSPQGRFAVVPHFKPSAVIVELSTRISHEYDYFASHPVGTLCAIDEGYAWVAYGQDGGVYLSDRNGITNYQCGVYCSYYPPSNARSAIKPVMTSDTRFVAFSAFSFNSIGQDSYYQVWLYDRLGQNSLSITSIVSGQFANNAMAVDPVFSGDNQTLTVSLIPQGWRGPTMRRSTSLIQIRLNNPDSDNDGLDDRFEMAYFNSLEQTGAGDFDHDGLSNAEEQQAATNPADGTSVLAVTAIFDAQTRRCTLGWRAKLGNRHRIEYKDGTHAPGWSILYDGLTATTAQVAYTDPTATTNRFYRVIVLP